MIKLVLKPVCLWMIVDIVVTSKDLVISVLLVRKSLAPTLDSSNARANNVNVAGYISDILLICNKIQTLDLQG